MSFAEQNFLRKRSLLFKVITYSLDGATDRTTDLTLRLTRFWDNGGRAPTAMAEPTVTLPRTEPGKLQTVTLDIPIGKIQDVVFMENAGYIDVEVLGGMYEKDNYYISRTNKPALKKSDVRVHKIELIKSPVSADHAMHASLRVIPPACSLGQAAGVAAAMSAKTGIPCDELDGKEVRAALKELGAFL